MRLELGTGVACSSMCATVPRMSAYVGACVPPGLAQGWFGHVVLGCLGRSKLTKAAKEHLIVALKLL